MKAFRITLIIALLVIGAGYLYWKKTEPEIPVSRTLVSQDGKSLEVTIVGKTGQVLHIERASDGGRFELPLGKLGWKDRFFAERLPVKTPPPVVVQKEEDEIEDPYIATRRARLEDLAEKQKDFTAEIESGSLSDILARKRQEDLFSIEREIRELEAAIEAHRRGSKRG